MRAVICWLLALIASLTYLFDPSTLTAACSTFCIGVAMFVTLQDEM